MIASELNRWLGRIAARVAAWPLARWRRILLALYLAAAAGDAAGKALASSDVLGSIVGARLHPAAAARIADARRPRGNFEIFRAAARHLVTGENLYAPYPDEVQDRFKYSPAFALLFAPFAWLPWPLALFLWNALNGLVLFVAVERVLAPRAAMVALSILLLEVLRAMQNAQSNTLVAGLVILAFAAIERGRLWRAAAAVALGASVKIFPLAALSFAIPRRVTARTVLAAGAVGVVLLALPLIVTSPSVLLGQYASWRAIESSDAAQRWFSVMELMHRLVADDWPNWPVQLAGTAVLLAPLAWRRDRWGEPRFHLLFLCSLLLYVVLFNHQAERASFVIAMAGVAIWLAGSPLAWWRAAATLVTIVTVTLMSTLIPVPQLMRSPTAMLCRLTVPVLAIWIMLQWELSGGLVTFRGVAGSLSGKGSAAR